jgi:7-cyano-7-deazaguanine synthase
VLIYSGGLDSTTLLYECRDSIALAVSFDYGSKHNAREIACAIENCKRLGVKHLVIPLGFIGQYFKSDLLLSGGEIPEGSYADENMKSTVVPFRNGIMLAVAAGLAESYGLDAVMLANHSGDHAIYPDCRPAFVEAFGRATEAGTYNGVKVVSPYCDITKRDIALRGKALGLDYSLTYSCYKGGEKHCGKCGTCTERKEALEGFDPTEYEA